MRDLFKNMGKDLIKFLNENKNINFNDQSDDIQIRIVQNFMDQVAVPLDWFKIIESESLAKHKKKYE